MNSYGKIFEHDFKQSAEKQGIWIMRINDTYVTAKKNNENENVNIFVPQQPCDYIAHYDGILYLLELKATERKFITIQTDANNTGMIKQHQYQQMMKHTGENERAYLILQFEREYTYALNIEDFYRFLQENDKKSINKLDAVQYNGIIIQQQQIRTHYCYNVKKLLEQGVN